MSVLDHKIDFAVVFSVNGANPNGDPLNGNRPRQDIDGYGEVSDVAIKRKIRNRWQDMGEEIFVKSADRSDDGFKSLRDRAKSVPEIDANMKKKGSEEEIQNVASEKWIDVRSFGQLFAFKGGSLSTSIRGPVTIRTAKSVNPINIVSRQITKSVNSVTSDKKGEDTMGTKHSVDFSVYVVYGSISPQLAEKVGYTKEDAEKLKQALLTLFENDASSARPAGSMTVEKVYWWEHKTKIGQYSSGRVHDSLVVESIENPKSFEDYKLTLKELEGLEVEVLDGF